MTFVTKPWTWIEDIVDLSIPWINNSNKTIWETQQDATDILNISQLESLNRSSESYFYIREWNLEETLDRFESLKEEYRLFIKYWATTEWKSNEIDGNRKREILAFYLCNYHDNNKSNNIINLINEMWLQLSESDTIRLQKIWDDLKNPKLVYKEVESNPLER